MRYRLSVDRLVNRLVPYYLAGRRFILLLQSCLHPLQELNDRFVELARRKHVEARMTSQVLYFEWFLNDRFGRYLQQPEDRIFLRDSNPVGVDIYHQAAEQQRPCTVWYQGEAITTLEAPELPRPLRRITEELQINKVSFMVCVPRIKLRQEEFVHMLRSTIDTYRLAGRTYLILIEGNEYAAS